MIVYNKAIKSPVAPKDLSVLWLDTSGTTYTFKVYENGEWRGVSDEQADVKELERLVQELTETKANKNGSYSELSAGNLVSWEEKQSLPIEDTWTEHVITSGGNVSIDSSAGAELVSIEADINIVDGVYKEATAQSFVTTGFNLLNTSNPCLFSLTGGYAFLVPKMAFGTFGTADEPNGVLFTDAEGKNFAPTVKFLPLFNSLGNTQIPTSVSSGTACTPTVSHNYSFYTTAAMGWLIVTEDTTHTKSNTCAHVAWSGRYDEYIAPSSNTDVGTIISIDDYIHNIHTYDSLIAVEGQGRIVRDAIVFNENSIDCIKRCDKQSVTWTNTEIEEGVYEHSATISTMKVGGIAVADNGSLLNTYGTTVSYSDLEETSDITTVYFELPTETVTTATGTNHMAIEDWGLMYFLPPSSGKFKITCQYYQGFPDTVAAIAQTRMNNAENNIEEIEEAMLIEQSLNDNLGNVKAISIDSETIPKVGQRPMILWAAGVPSASLIPLNWDIKTMGEWTGIPTHIGQLYINTSASSAGVYYAKDTSAVGDWKQA